MPALRTAAILVLTASLLAASLRAQSVEVADDDPVVPLFNPLLSQGEVFLTGLVGTGSSPGTGLYSALANFPAGEMPQLRVWKIEGPMDSPRGRATVGTATLILPTGIGSLTNRIATLAAARFGDELDCWRLINTDEVQPIAVGVLEWIKDGIDFSTGRVDDELQALDLEAYAEFLSKANMTSDAAFQRAAKPGVQYVNLHQQPRLHRGEVVRFEGRLKLLRRFDPPRRARELGVRDVYEGWMFDPELWGANPLCILFTELPPGLELGEKMDRKVAFAGYFFRKFRYTARDSLGTRHEVPMLIGRTVKVLDQAQVAAQEGEGDGWARDLLPLFLSIILGTMVAIFGLTLLFRRADGNVRRRINAVRVDDGFVPPLAEEER